MIKWFLLGGFYYWWMSNIMQGPFSITIFGICCTVIIYKTAYRLIYREEIKKEKEDKARMEAELAMQREIWWEQHNYLMSHQPPASVDEIKRGY